MSAIFTYAIRLGYLKGVPNPVRETKAEGTATDPQLHAYTLDEVAYMLKKLSGRAKVAVGIAAFTGLRESEIRGLQVARLHRHVPASAACGVAHACGRN